MFRTPRPRNMTVSSTSSVSRMSFAMNWPPVFVLILVWLLAQGAEAFRITGAVSDIDPTSETLPSRYEINGFATSGPAFDLYILALQSIQDQDQSDFLSYYQVAGIHGYPVAPWDGVVGKGPGIGYCMHNSVLFPTWHRPYLALLEQMISTRAQTIARTYPTVQRGQYQDAARKLRIPYWDWASNPGLPEVVTLPIIPINTPYGYTEVQNPLYMYTFHPDREGNGIPNGHPLSNILNTVRHYDPATGESNNSAATAVLIANAPSTLSLTYQFLASADDYTSVSCVWTGGHYNPPFNLENIHNNIHNYVGGFGHMTYPELSAFDPVFWLHHANVDRLLAVWQTMHPQSYVAPAVNLYGTYYETRGTIDTEITNLAPFHSDNGTTMFTSDGVRNTAIFGYTYPELVNNNNLSTADLQRDVIRKINQLYAPSAMQGFDQPKLGRRASSIEHAFSHVSLETIKSLEVNNREVQWLIVVSMDRNGYNGRSVVDFFIGALPPISRSAMAANLIGSYRQFVPASSSDLDTSAGLVHGGISLTHTLVVGMARAFLEDLSAESVIPVLRDHLHWRARSDDNLEIELEKLSGLTISVQSRQVEPRKSLEEVPMYGRFETHVDVTAGKVGGLGYVHK